jgi:hypothetical protein
MTNSDVIVSAADERLDYMSVLLSRQERKALIVKTILELTAAVAKDHGLTLADIEDIDGFLSMPYVPLETKEVVG